MDKKEPKAKVYKNIKGLTEALSQLGFFQEKETSTEEEVKELRSTVKVHSWLIIGVLIIVGIAFIAFIVDTLIFHINNNKYFENVYELRLDLERLKANHPEFFNK